MTTAEKLEALYKKNYPEIIKSNSDSTGIILYMEISKNRGGADALLEKSKAHIDRMYTKYCTKEVK